MESNPLFSEASPLVQQIAVIVSVVVLTLALIAAVGYIYFHPNLPLSSRTLLTEEPLVDNKGNPVEPYCFSSIYGGTSVNTSDCLPDWAERIGPVTVTNGTVSAVYRNKGAEMVEMHSYKILDLGDNVLYIQAIGGTPESPSTRIVAITSGWEPNTYKVLWSQWGDYSDYGITDVVVGYNTVMVKEGLGVPYFFHNQNDRTNAIEGIYVNSELIVGVLNAAYDIEWRRDQEPDKDYECVTSEFDAYRKRGEFILTPTQLTDFGAAVVAACGLEEYGVGL